ncbi:MAG: bifunctional phosphoribosylaminoimidazolecarboxamide formyltransferase/IMP cyclohydrolase [Acidobacteria bacterium]|nr:bifunctional phosphoribosylaminoimidazolecarboxamide formyltransferase/IMP cyclohydrolase [Acidobacteriota bacterium]MDW7983066.1 bifunctional phosphoribosylaminoimidazolecarboxamide formyltransferase/IMP cyclohydrolase [Acidobacteriota bacterium]
MASRRALISVYDKTGLTDLARALADHRFEILVTSGTAQLLRAQDIYVRRVEDVTGFPEVLGGRVKTLHPAVFAGILARRDRPEDEAQLRQYGLAPVDLVVVNLYPFEAWAQAGLSLEQLMDWVDIGGVALIRAAAKNWPWVTVLVEPTDYPTLVDVLRQGTWPPPESFRRAMAAKAFAYTAVYDAVITARFYQERGLAEPVLWPWALVRHQPLRYGENPHQWGHWYAVRPEAPVALHRARQLQGKELSYNNILDLDAAVRVVADFEGEAEGVVAVVIKHNTPSGVAVAATARDAYVWARAADTVAAFGGIAGIGGVVDEAAAEAIVETFLECVIAPGYTDGALQVLARKKNLRVLELSGPWRPDRSVEVRSVLGGVLVQDGDWPVEDPEQWRVVTKRAPSEAEWRDLAFAWRVAKHVKSNAIVLARDLRTVGIGGGQVSRVDAVRVAVQKAPAADLRAAVAASDAFFPFRDGVDELAQAGVTAVVQPGGSIRDDEVIQAADEHGMAMVFTGLRHFRH